MPYSLQQITDTWGDWSAKQYGTTKWYVESTKYSNQSTLDQYYQYETKATPISTDYGNNSGAVEEVSGEDLWFDNGLTTEQTNTFHYEKSHEGSFTWGFTEALKVGTEVKVTAGVPAVFDGGATITAEIELSANQTWTTTTTTTWSNDTTVTVPAKKSVKCHTALTVQGYNVPFTSRVSLKGCVAIWYNDKVARRSDKNDLHWLWFINIVEVFQDVIDNKLVATDGYYIDGDHVVATVNGNLTGDRGVSVNVVTDEFSLRGWTPTEADVQQDVQDNLKAAAQEKVQSEYPSLADGATSLTSSMKILAAGRFEDAFGQELNANYCPAECQGTVQTVNQSCILYGEQNLDTQISTFVDTYVLSSMDLPSWMKSTAKADIVTLIKSLVTSQVYNECDDAQFVRSYDAANSDQNSMKCTLILVYANGTSTECAITASVHAIHILGASYPINSPTASTTKKLQTAAYDAAERLSTNTSTINDDTTLATTLSDYGALNFKAKFGYEYQSTPIDYPTDESQALLTRNDHLGYFQDRDTDKLDTYVKQEIFNGLNITIADAETAALQDVQDEFKAIFADTEEGAWNVQYIDKTYLLDRSTMNPVAINGLIVYWYDHQTISAKVSGADATLTISVTYVYFMGVVHELKPDSLAQDLFIKLCNNIPDNKDTDPKGDLVTLKNDLESYTNDGFKNDFGFNFGDDPTDMKSGTKSKSFSRLFEFSGIPTKDQIKEKIDNELFTRNDTGFTHCGGDIYDDLVDKINYRAGPDTVKTDNEWQQNSITTQFDFQGNDTTTHTIKQYALYTFVDGKMTEDGRGGKTIETFYISYLGAFCMIVSEPASDDDL